MCVCVCICVCTHTHIRRAVIQMDGHGIVFLSMVSFVSFISGRNKAFLCTQRKEREKKGERKGREEEERDRGGDQEKHSALSLFCKGRVLIQVFGLGNAIKLSCCHGDGIRCTAEVCRGGKKEIHNCIFPSLLPLLPLVIWDAEIFFCGTCECQSYQSSGWETLLSWKSEVFQWRSL